MPPAAKQGDQVTGMDIHIVMIPSPGGPVPTPLPHPFSGMLDGNLSSDVFIQGKAAATKDSTANCVPPHIPQGGPFQNPPANKATIMMGSMTVKINGKPAARISDLTNSCNDPTDAPTVSIIPAGPPTVNIGG